jgi:hypothetical protein
MKAENPIVKTFAAMALVCGLSISAQAQIGSGWTPDGETYTAQTSSGCTITPISGGFEFSVPSGHGRAEQRGNNLPSNTTNQWQGFGTLKSFPSGSNKITLHQVFGPAPSTPDLILDEATGGPTGIEIMSLEQGDAFEAAIQVGVQFQLNTVYDPVGNLITIFVNGSQTGTKTPNSGTHYNKYGQYVSRSGSGPATMDWVNVQSWAGGSLKGGGTTVATPSFSPGGGTYTSAQVSITDSTSGATIHYTTDGSTPTSSSAVYSSPIPVSSGTVTIEAIGTKSGDTTSSVASATYTISSGGGIPVATPSFSPGGGTYTSSQNVSISDSTGGATIYYTTDGSTPTTSSTVYSGPIPVSSGTVTIEAIGAKSGDTTSSVASATYTISSSGGSEPAPAFSEPSGTYTKEVHVRVTDSDSNASLYYTTDGSTPTASSTPVPDHTIEFKSTTTLNAIAIDHGATSNVTSATYTID